MGYYRCINVDTMEPVSFKVCRRSDLGDVGVSVRSFREAVWYRVYGRDVREGHRTWYYMENEYGNCGWEDSKWFTDKQDIRNEKMEKILNGE